MNALETVRKLHLEMLLVLYFNFNKIRVVWMFLCWVEHYYYFTIKCNIGRKVQFYRAKLIQQILELKSLQSMESFIDFLNNIIFLWKYRENGTLQLKWETYRQKSIVSNYAMFKRSLSPNSKSKCQIRIGMSQNLNDHKLQPHSNF